MPRGTEPSRRTRDREIAIQDIVDAIEDEVIVVDSDYRVRFANSAVGRRMGRDIDALMGRHCYSALHNRDSPCAAPLWDCPVKDVLQKGKPRTIIHTDPSLGTDRYLKITAYPLQDQNSNPRYVVEVARDVSAQRELESQVLRRHHQFLALSQIATAVSGLWDLDTTLRVGLDNALEIVNGAIGGILLLDEESETLYYRVQKGLSATYAEGMRIPPGEGIAGKVAQTGEPMWLEDISQDPQAAHPDLVSAEGLKGFVSVPLKSKEKTVGVMNIASQTAGRPAADDASLLHSIGHYLGTAIEQATLHERLSRSRERYQTLLQHSLTAQEEERKRIARELHDETSQTITSITLSLQALIGIAEMNSIGDEEFRERLRTIHTYALRAGNEIVNLMKELRPTLLDELGLPSAIHRYAKDVLQPRGIDVSADFKGLDERLGPEVEVTLFRIAQGAIGNILEHSGAKSVVIELKSDAKECVLRIQDDGAGFDVTHLTQVDSSGRGSGLFTMKERARTVGGRCRVLSRSGQGTTVEVRIPLGGEALDEEDTSVGSG
jgi:PAS domain S-box-containing protein